MTKDINFEAVGKLLILLREKSGKEQQEIAKALNVSNAAVSLWESGNGIQTEKIYDLARYYNISVAELISGQLNDENEEDYFQRNYDLKKHPSFEEIDETNYKDLLDYLSRCNNVIKRIFKLYPSYISCELNKKETNEFNVLMSCFSIDYSYVQYRNYDFSIDSLRELVEELTNIHGFKEDKDLDYELSLIYELKIDVNPYEVISFSEETSNKYLSLLTPQQRDELLTNYLVGKTVNEIESSTVILRLLNSGAKCLYRYEDILNACENYDSDVLEGLEGKVAEDKDKEFAYKYFKKIEKDIYTESEKFFDPRSYKLLSKKDYSLMIDKETTNDVDAMVRWRINKPKLYMDYLKQKNKDFLAS